MAIRSDGQDEGFRRTANLPTITAFTVMGWFKISTDRNNYQNFFVFGRTGLGQPYVLQTDNDGTTLRLYAGDGVTASNGTALSVGTWYHMAMVCDGTGANNLRAYLNGVLDISISGNGSQTADELVTCRDSAGYDQDNLDGCFAALKIYDAVLTAAEIANEMRCYVPLRTANLNCWSPCHEASVSDADNDYSGNGYDWTTLGTMAVEDGPPIPWKTGRHRLVYVPAAAAATTGNVTRMMLGMGM